MEYVTQRLRRCGADNVVLLIDACRDEDSRSGLGIGRQEHKGVITFYSCTANQPSWEIDELKHGSFTYTLLEGLRLQGKSNCATVERLNQYLSYEVPRLNARYKKPNQNPYLKAEPPYKMYFVLLEQSATLRDVEPLKYQASLAENKGNLLLAKQLWVRVLAVSRADWDAIDAIGRIALRQGRSTAVREESVVPIPESVRGGRSVVSELSPVTISNTKLQTFSFDVLTVDERGQEVKREKGQAQYFTEDLGNGVSLEMVYIPGGEFMMGSPEGEGYDFEKPQHEVNVQPFFIGKFQITQAQWQELTGNNLETWQDRSLNPVERLYWDDVVEFCQRLSERTGKEYRLPTEAEWEYACRAGTRTPFHFGETITTDLANYNGNDTYASEPLGEYREKTTPVGSFPPNAFGLYDLHGNVWEWCEDDWHKNYNGAPSDGSAWSSGEVKASKVLRGGSWNYPSVNCRSAYRGDYAREICPKNFGFRVVCVISRNKYQQNLQKSLQLTDEEASQIEESIVEQKEAEAWKQQEEERIRQQQEAEELRRQQKEAERLRQQQEVENRSNVTESVADSKPTIEDESLSLQVFEFDVVKVNDKGQEVNRKKGQAQYFTEDLGNGVGLDMVYIPGSSFLMGSPEGEGYDSEKPQHKVTVQPFFMGKFQVTQSQWRAIAKTDPSNFKGDNLPVEQVSWEEAEEFCQKLSKQTGKEYHLPTEAKWEYACRAGTTAPFHFGENITDRLANYGSGQTIPVGSFSPNAFGLYDMHGNVWEWCEDDWHGSYQGAPTDGNAWRSGISSKKVIRGGAWNYYPDLCRSAYRSIVTRDLRNRNIGFRVMHVIFKAT